MTLAWEVTEVIRYTYYALNILNIEPYPLLWLRYTTFYALYPIGAGSEAFLMFSTLPVGAPPTISDFKNFSVVNWVVLALYTLWWPGEHDCAFCIIILAKDLVLHS